MSLYTAIRFRGIVKPEFRDIFEPIALHGKWKESPDDVLRDFGECNRSASYIPCASACIIDRWQKEPWKTGYSKETGEWVFEVDINTYSLPVCDFEDEIIPYLMESVEHYEVWHELWTEDKNYTEEYTALEKFENGEMKLLGWLMADGSFESCER